jgi:hypothetical protein
MLLARLSSDNRVQSEKALSPTVVTVEGMLMEEREEEQP